MQLFSWEWGGVQRIRTAYNLVSSQSTQQFSFLVNLSAFQRPACNFIFSPFWFLSNMNFFLPRLSSFSYCTIIKSIFLFTDTVALFFSLCGKSCIYLFIFFIVTVRMKFAFFLFTSTFQCWCAISEKTSGDILCTVLLETQERNHEE